MWITFWEKKQHSFVSLFIFSLWNDLLLSFVNQMELLDIYELSMLEQLPDKFNPPLFPYVGWTPRKTPTNLQPLRKVLSGSRSCTYPFLYFLLFVSLC